MKNLILTILLISGLSPAHWTCVGQSNSDSVKYIKHGTKFGMCSGYCFNETKYENDLITTLSKSWKKGKNDGNSDKIDTLKIDAYKWKKLIESFDINEFYKLQKRIGCPDCNDGGAEWVEIETNEKSYKVEFEYGADIEKIKKLLELLRPQK